MKGIDKLDIREVAGGAVVAVKVVPGASRDRVMGILGDALKIATAAAPEKGKANAAVAKLLAAAAGVDPRDVTLHSGRTSPRKEFHIADLSAAHLRRRLGSED